jgi:hypothetical protein
LENLEGEIAMSKGRRIRKDYNNLNVIAAALAAGERQSVVAPLRETRDRSPEPKRSQEKPQRLGLADLKRALLARRKEVAG